jgi:hypothetical protein
VNRGSCLCGTLRYEIDAPFQQMMHCHCSMCRKHHGAPFATYATAPVDALRWRAGEEALAQYRSSEQVTRAFCRKCGSVAPALFADLPFVDVPAGNLEGDPGIRPQRHLFVGSRAPWIAITDGLPQHATLPPELGGGDGFERPAVQPRDGVTEGTCLCGEVAYEFTGKPLRMWNCHCSRCRRARSAAHCANLFVPVDGFRWTRGEGLVVEYQAPEARFFGVAFCTRCGGNVPRVSLARGWVVVPAGALDTDPGVRPQAHIYVGSKAPWFEITDELPQFADAPPV